MTTVLNMLLSAGSNIFARRCDEKHSRECAIFFRGCPIPPNPLNWLCVLSSHCVGSIALRQGRIGGDAPLTAAGKVYAGKLAEFMKRRYPPRRQEQQPTEQQSSSAPTGSSGGGDGDGREGGDDDEELVVWTSTMLRTGQTVAPMALHREVRAPWIQCCRGGGGGGRELFVLF